MCIVSRGTKARPQHDPVRRHAIRNENSPRHDPLCRFTCSDLRVSVSIYWLKIPF
jgi:hypothetical protein